MEGWDVREIRAIERLGSGRGRRQVLVYVDIEGAVW